MDLLGKNRRTGAAMLGVAAGLAAVIVLIGIAFLLWAKFLGGGQQTINATDAGALSAGRAMLSVAVPESSITPELQGTGVNVPANGNPALPSTTLLAGAPDDLISGSGTLGKYDILAYNRAAGAAAIMAMNLESMKAQIGEHGQPLATTATAQYVSDVINGTGHSQGIGLKQFGENLNSAMAADAQTGGWLAAGAFQATASANSVNMMGPKSSTTLESLNFACLPTGFNGDLGKAGIYFDSQMANNDPVFLKYFNQLADKSGTIKSNVPAYANTSMPGAQAGVDLVQAYTGLTIGSSPPIYFSADNPASDAAFLVNNSRFSSAALGQQSGYAPFNTVQGQATTRLTSPNNTGTNLTTIATAMVGSLGNQYPASLPLAYICIDNNPDARVINAGNTITGTNQTLATLGLVGTMNGYNSLFNNQLMVPGLAVYVCVVPSGNMVYEPIDQGGLLELQAWADYNASIGLDPLGHNPALFPPFLGFPMPPHANLGDLFGKQATLAEMLGVAGPAWPTPICSDNNIEEGSFCASMVPVFEDFYGSQTQSDLLPPYPQSAMTNAEAFKSELLTEWDRWNSCRSPNFSFTTTGSEFASNSGMHLYSRSQGLAVPTNTPSVIFGTDGTPYQYLKMLAQYGAPNIDPDNNANWTNTSTVLGQIYQRALQILPTASIDDVRNLLNQYPSPIGTRQYIYLPSGGASLTISPNPPPFWGQRAAVGGLGDYNNDVIVQDSAFAGSYPDGPMYNMFNAEIGVAGNSMGEGFLHLDPFQTVNAYVETNEYLRWVPDTGANQGFLGKLQFADHVGVMQSANHVGVNGTATFSQPN